MSMEDHLSSAKTPSHKNTLTKSDKDLTHSTVFGSFPS